MYLWLTVGFLCCFYYFLGILSWLLSGTGSSFDGLYISPSIVPPDDAEADGLATWVTGFK